MTKKHYKQRDAYEIDYFTDKSYYSDHVSAMTKEKLNTKSGICAELGIRDIQIDILLEYIKDIDTDQGTKYYEYALAHLPEFEYIEKGGSV